MCMFLCVCRWHLLNVCYSRVKHGKCVKMSWLQVWNSTHRCRYAFSHRWEFVTDEHVHSHRCHSQGWISDSLQTSIIYFIINKESVCFFAMFASASWNGVFVFSSKSWPQLCGAPSERGTSVWPVSHGAHLPLPHKHIRHPGAPTSL